MNGTELDEILSLLRRVLPDPSGFAERLIEQALGRVAEQSRGGEAMAGIRLDPESSHPIREEPDPAHETPHEFNDLLASALGACECWGDDTDCGRCAGRGASGWLDPDPDLFQIFVGPAVERLSTTFGHDEVATTPSSHHERRPYMMGDMR